MSEWLLLQEGALIYLFIFLFLLGGAIGLPIPEDVPLLISGILAQTGRVNVQLIAVLCYGGILLGDIIIFSVGRWLGPAVFQKEWFKSRINPSKVNQLKVGLEQRSLLMIFLARHLFYLRSITFLSCGAVRMRFSKFILADAMAALISVPLVMTVGYLVAEHYDIALRFLQRAKELTLLGVIILAALWYFWWKRKNPSSK